MQRTSSIRSLMLVSVSGSQSLAKPGSMPLTHSDTPASSAAWRTPADISSGTTPSGYCRNTGLDDTTLTPARSRRSRSVSASKMRLSAMAVCTTQSGSSASSASASLVATTPRSRSSPASLPASTPTLSGFDTHTPTSSRSGRASMPAIACRPTLPVLHCTTRYVIVSPPDSGFVREIGCWSDRSRVQSGLLSKAAARLAHRVHHLVGAVPHLCVGDFDNLEAGSTQGGQSHFVVARVGQREVIRLALDLDEQRKVLVAEVDPSDPPVSARVDLPPHWRLTRALEHLSEPSLETARGWNVIIATLVE